MMKHRFFIWWIESLEKNCINVFSATFDTLNASLMSRTMIWLIDWLIEDKYSVS